MPEISPPIINPVVTPLATQAAVLDTVAPVAQANVVVASAMAAMQSGMSQLLINPVPGNPNAQVIYAPSDATIAAILADLQGLSDANLALLAPYGITS